MSLLDGRHHVYVHVPVDTGERDRYGMSVKRVVVKQIACNVQHVSASESHQAGVQGVSQYRVLAKDWPGTVGSLVEYDGRKFEQVGEARWFTRSPATTHAEVTIQPQTTR